MTQLFGEHCQHRRTAGAREPVSIEIDGAGARRIGPHGGWHGASGQYHYRRQILEGSITPTRHDLLKAGRNVFEQERFLSRPGQGACIRPEGQQRPPVPEKIVKERLGHGWRRRLESGQESGMTRVALSRNRRRMRALKNQRCFADRVSLF